MPILRLNVTENWRYGEAYISQIDFDGIVMTDSGGYQGPEYGDIEIGPETMAKFQIDIGSDLPVILDRPTGYRLDYGKARNFVKRGDPHECQVYGRCG